MVANGESHTEHVENDHDQKDRDRQGKKQSKALPHLWGLSQMMTTEEVRTFLRGPNRVLKSIALSYVALGELESMVIYLRYDLLLTQERALDRLPKLYAERLGITEERAAQEYGVSFKGFQKIERRALEKCAEAWSNLAFVKEVLKREIQKAAQ